MYLLRGAGTQADGEEGRGCWWKGCADDIEIWSQEQQQQNLWFLSSQGSRPFCLTLTITIRFLIQFLFQSQGNTAADMSGACLRSHSWKVIELEFTPWSPYPLICFSTAKHGRRSQLTDQEAENGTSQGKPSPGSQHAWEKLSLFPCLASC